MKMFKVLTSMSLVFVLSVPTLVSAEQDSPVSSNIPVYFSSNVKDDLSYKEKEKITSQLAPTATSITIVESAPITVPAPLSRVSQCVEGGIFRNTSQTGSYVFKLGVSGTRYINKTGSNLIYTSTISNNATIGGEVNGEGKFDWGPIEAKVGFKMSGSYTWATTESTVITIRPHYQGWNDYGTMNDYWTGYYAYLTTSCTEINGKNIIANGPRQKAVVANEIYANY